MLRNKGVVYLSFHLSKSDVKHMTFSIPNHLCLAWIMYKNVFSWSCYFAFIVRLLG